MAGERVLVVEDEAVIARDLAQRLHRLGYVVAAVATSGERAIPLARSLAPDLVLMDVTLPGAIDGIAAAETIMADRAVPIVFVTGAGDPDTLARAKPLAPSGWVLKPFDDRDLGVTVELALARHAVEQSERERAALRAVMTLAAATAHEVNNPLTVVKGTLQLLERRPADAPTREARIAAALEAVDRIAEIVGRLSRITRLETQRTTPNIPAMLDIVRSSEGSDAV